MMTDKDIRIECCQHHCGRIFLDNGVFQPVQTGLFFEVTVSYNKLNAMYLIVVLQDDSMMSCTI